MLNSLAMLGSGQDLIIILVIVIVLFGGKKIPELLRGVGKGVGELQKGLEEGKKTIYTAAEEKHEPEAKPGDSTTTAKI